LHSCRHWPLAKFIAICKQLKLVNYNWLSPYVIYIWLTKFLNDIIHFIFIVVIL